MPTVHNCWYVWVYLIHISSQLHQQGDCLSHCNSVVDVIALQTRLQFGEVTIGRVTEGENHWFYSLSPLTIPIIWKHDSSKCLGFFSFSSLFHPLVEQNNQSGSRTEGDQQWPGLKGGTVEARTARFGHGERSLSVGVGRHEHALQKGQRLDQVLGGYRKCKM